MSDKTCNEKEAVSTQAFERPGNIVLVSAEPDVQQGLANFLERQLHQVTIASDGADLFALLRTERPDLLLCDSRLGELKPSELCRAIKADPELQYIAVVLLGDADDTNTQVAAFKAGANDFFTRPFNHTIIDVRIRSLLKYRRAVTAYRRSQGELERRVKERTDALTKSNADLQKEINERRDAESAL
ncbi:MAG TPA: response regulator, partial [Planctomycetota bacterium]|nr:response regulator [Planctomycetota bacterium]